MLDISENLLRHVLTVKHYAILSDCLQLIAKWQAKKKSRLEPTPK